MKYSTFSADYQQIAFLLLQENRGLSQNASGSIPAGGRGHYLTGYTVNWKLYIVFRRGILRILLQSLLFRSAQWARQSQEAVIISMAVSFFSAAKERMVSQSSVIVKTVTQTPSTSMKGQMGM